MSVSDPSDRFEVEASRNAERVMSQPAGRAGLGRRRGAACGAAVQRHADRGGDRRTGRSTTPRSLPAARGRGEEEMQAAHDDSLGPVQRQGSEEEEEQA